MESRKLLPNASCFAFTATPKNRTLQIFGDPDPQPIMDNQSFKRWMTDTVFTLAFEQAEAPETAATADS